MTTVNTPKMLSFADLDLSGAAADGFEFEAILDGLPGGSGLFITVQGDQSDAFKQAERKALNLFRQKENLRTKKQGPDSVRLIEEDEQFTLDLAARRIIGWRGLHEEFSFENAQRLLALRPELVEQVVTHAKNVANFIKSK
jgi:hypothetical protein